MSLHASTAQLADTLYMANTSGVPAQLRPEKILTASIVTA
ncbi:hypothetical protein PI124_g21123 [Phytophthora idaei]|nr:hypothetical protein PI125_g23051 [Phytophthora idaei]KAG3129587.1 hypothetical protein PI126_g20901 [Phytophthora idaei]KAG3233818.1 hypothetical protein PI124_g21123 [Phytophthora idaei]